MPRINAALPVLRDAGLGLVVIAVLWLTAAAPDSLRLPQLGLAAVALIAVLLRKRWPLIAVVASVVATCVAWVLGVTLDPFVLSGWCVFVVAERRGTRAAPWWMIASGAALVIALGLGATGIEDRLRGMLLGAVVLCAAWLLGVRTREAERNAARRSRTEERLRLARDVHDVLSHSLGAIGVRAGVSAHVATLSEDDLRGALRGIEQDARGSLAELTVLLDRERAGTTDPGGAADAGGEPLAAPLGGMLVDLTRPAERVGIRTNIDLRGDLDSAPADVRTTLHRVVQEAVTNVIRHASASSLSVAVARHEAGVHLEVRDDGVGGAPGTLTEGHGLTGIRERVALVGGTVDIGTAGPGFVVSVSLPITGAVAREAGTPS